MSTQAKGTFSVKMTPQAPYDTVESVSLGRISIAKVFEGDIAGTSTVEMISARGEIPNSAGYVAIERASVTIAGKTGTFVMQHSGTMTRGNATLSVTVVPDSGTGGLKGISGQMKIDIVEGKHLYTFDYSFDVL